MPKKISVSNRQAQAQNRRTRELEKRHKQRREYLRKLQAREKRETDALLKRAMKNVRGKGIYEPKALTLTPYRKTRIRKVLREYRDLIQPDKYFFVKAPKQDIARVQERAAGMDFKATRTGVFIPREGFRQAVLKKDPTNNELYIERRGKVKRGPTRGKRYTRRLPLASLDELDAQKDRIRRMGESFGKLKGNERLTFSIHEAGVDGYTNKTFSNIDLLLRFLENYRKQIGGKWTRTMPSFIHFLTLIEVEKTESSLKWQIEHPPRDARERRARLKRSKEERIRGR